MTCCRRFRLTAAVVVALICGLVACGSERGGQSRSTASAGAVAAAGGSAAPPPCPGAPVDVAVSVDQWADIVSQLGGACAQVKTVLVSSSVDPHDYEPSPRDAASFSGARLIVVNGADYDPWASKLAAISAPVAPVVSAAEVTRTADGANPHLWYSPSAVTAVADAVSAELSKIDPRMQAYFTGRRSAFSTTLQPYTRLIDTIKVHAAGKSYAATEGIFTYMADALGLVNKTPQGYQQAAASESDPSPADLQAFLDALAGHRIDVLIYNPQTEGSIPDQIRVAAERANVPVVTVTETVPQDQTTFAGWQDTQLTKLAKALGVPL
ncbi:metal ABC transporter solute-binding protein, Zn/Mn family [Candidatus Mycobacterium methanotrophicum]|uniref:Zinc ABC transporter substrate-binding protein n=1 Tax=Candidatus Mycobacterium methanotrophicum TaxID=2943498 RepID=A0ABY4QFY8_9MYCO|nr:zinc ABC transporter substrate-binding protein [Candidatus Mycobacterium methanotrophicum]UQX09293.1 zinc ABC transporter substrate-binding protein [Candidatus Mycobacterium methanotrophicum]